MKELGRKTVEEFRESEKIPVIVVLENIRSGYNVGSVFRTSDALLVEAIYIMMKNILHDQEHFDIRYGCPAINLVEEMAPLNKGFKNTLTEFAKQWQEAIQECIRHGKAKGIVRQDVDGRQVAVFVISGYGGVRNMGKVFGMQCYTSYLKELKNYLKTLK